jgi:hypothetical protein
MDEERTTLSDDEILTTGIGETHRSQVMDADEDDADTSDSGDDADDSDSDADTDEPS